MSAQSRRELLLALRQSYLNASWIEKKQLLDGFVTATGYHRKYAVALLSKGLAEKQGKRNKKRVYDGAVFDALLVAWKAANRICSKRLIPFLPSLIESLERFGHLDISEKVKEQLLSMSAATADRLLKPERRKLGKSRSTTKPGKLIRKHVPIRTFADWNDVVPGFLEGDLVAHCGGHVHGQYLNTLTLTDIATGWTELRALLGKSEADVLQEVDHIEELLPFPLLGFDTDNGGEFLNYGLIDWCERNKITALSEPDQSNKLEEIIALPSKEGTRHEINFLTRQEVDALLAATKRITWFDRRDQALLRVAVDTGMLVSELTALQPQDVDIENAQVRIVGRRRKERHMPLEKGTLAVLKSWLQEPAKSKRKILFQNPSGRRLTSNGVRYILSKHLTAASEICPSLLDKQVTLYWLRHTKALELLQAGVERSQVALWLGMESAVFTNIYDSAHLARRKLSAPKQHPEKAKIRP